jgi:hypothetical protein
MISAGRERDIPVIPPPQMGDYTVVGHPLKLRIIRSISKLPKLNYKR